MKTNKNKNYYSPLKIDSRVRSPFSGIIKIKTKNNGIGKLKAVLVFGIIGVQTLLFILLHSAFMLSYKWTALFTLVMSLITCIYVLSSNKNSQSKAVWIIFLLIFFPFSYIFYLINDERVIMLGAGKKYSKTFNDSQKFISTSCKRVDNQNVINDCTYLYNAGGFLPYTNTKAEYFSSGTEFFDDVIEKLKGAKKFIFIEFFILADGILFERIFELLSGLAKKGVDIRIIYDDMGSHRVLKRKTKKMIRRAGIKIMPFNKVLPFFSVALNYRDHRKIIVIDGECAYTGGCNLADEYINVKRMHGYWKDAGIRLDGEACSAFTIMFLRQWEILTKQKEDYSAFFCKTKIVASKSVFVPYADGLEYKRDICKGVYENMIASAKQKIYIMTPYFIVDDYISNMLKTKAMSGVDVRIIIPEIPDKTFVYGVTRNNAEKLASCGVKVYLMKSSFVHSKVLLNEVSVAIGSVNMDLRSFYQQFECGVFTDDQKTIEKVNLDFESTFTNSILITEKNKLRNGIIYRAFAGVMQIFAPFM